MQDRLKEALEHALAQLSPETVAAIFAEDDTLSVSLESRLNAQLAVYYAAEGLEEVLAKDERIPSDGQYMVRFDNGSTNFSFQLGSAILRQAILRGGADAAIEWVQKVFAYKAATGKIISPVWGVSVPHAVDLGNGIKLLPFDQVPDGPQKRWLHNSRIEQRGLISSMLQMQEFEAALVMDRVIDEPIYRYVDAAEKAPAVDTNAHRIHELFADSALVLAVVGPRFVIPVCRWFAYDDPDLECATGGGFRQSQLHELLPLRIPSYPQLDEQAARQVIKSFFALPDKAKKTVRIAIARLQQSLIRHSVGNAAVELSIALEALLGDNQTSEMTHKVTVRAVRLLGGDFEQRKRNFSMFKKTYAIRSALVHRGEEPSGEVSIGDKKMTLQDMLAEVSFKCADLICRVMDMGGIPNWTEFDYTEHGEPSDAVETR